MAPSGAAEMVDHLARKRDQYPRLVQCWAGDRGRPDFREQLRREAELVRGHVSTREANEFLGELLDEMLADADAGRP